MPSTNKSPYASSFRSAIKRGTPSGKAVEAIAKRNNTRPGVVYNSLHKAGLCHRQKFNGQWVYWPCEDVKTSATSAKAVQTDLWQNFIDWCIVSGQCKPQQLDNQVGSQQAFMTFCKKYFSRQINGSSSSSSRKSSSSRPRSSSPASRRTSSGRTTSARTRSSSTSRQRTSSPSSYKFPRTSSSSRRLRRAA